MDAGKKPVDETTHHPPEDKPVSAAVASLRGRRFAMIALALWTVPLLVISIMVFQRPEKRTVTPLYHEATTNWWAREALYQGPSGMNYLPQFPILFTPFHAIPSPWGDIVWRLFSAALLITGLWRVLRLQFGPSWQKWFLWTTLLAMPLSLGAFRNGQANALLGGLILHAVACLAAKQWNRAAVLIVLTLAVKPLGAVLVLLAPVVYAPLRWRVPVGLAALIALPFLCAPTPYAIAQYRALGGNLKDCSAVQEHRFADLNGILRTFGSELPPRVATIVRAMAGLAAAALGWLGAKRLTEPLQAMWLLALTTGYLMLFNPMNEANSYVILAPALGLWTVHWLSDPATARRGWVLVAMTVSMSLLPNLVRPLFGNHFALIWHPVMTLGFGVLLTLFVWQRNTDQSDTHEAGLSPA
ncbi:MAG: glycosyltransferase family 87 protein [Verrucomicrobiota bacterium]